MAPSTSSRVYETARLTLRPVAVGDAEETAALMAPSISQMLTTWPERMSLAEAVARIQDSIAETRQTLWSDWAIRVKSTSEMVGWIGLGRRAADQQRYTVGLWLGEAHQGRGLGGEAVDAVLGHARNLRATAVEAEIYQHNDRSRALFEKLGFRRIGTHEIHSPVRGRAAPGWVYERAPV